jgi:hypothetical protein
MKVFAQHRLQLPSARFNRRRRRGSLLIYSFLRPSVQSFSRPASHQDKKRLNKMAPAGIFKCGKRWLPFKRCPNADPKLHSTRCISKRAGQSQTGDDIFLRTLKPIQLGDN